MIMYIPLAKWFARMPCSPGVWGANPPPLLDTLHKTKIGNFKPTTFIAQIQASGAAV